MLDRVRLLLLAALLVSAVVSASDRFECYVGRGDNVYNRQMCDQCRFGTPCMCIKIPNFPGLQVPMCLCETELCNSSTLTSGSKVITAVVVAIVAFATNNLFG